MNRLQIDFIDAPRRPLWTVVAICLAFLWTSAVLRQWVTLRSELQRDQARGTDLGRLVRARSTATPAHLGPVPGQIDADNTMRSMLAYPWNQFFLQLEQSIPPNLSIVELTHGQTEDKTEMTVEARDLAAVLQFVAALNDGPQQHSWYVTGYQISPSGVAPVTAHIRRR